MAKFRSWNENRNQFYYWQDGYYFKNKECTDDWNMIQVWFNWQNAEMFGETDNTEFAEGDNVKIIYNDRYNHKQELCGIIIFEDNAFIIDVDYYDRDHFTLNELVVCEIEVLGNIHEVQE